MTRKTCGMRGGGKKGMLIVYTGDGKGKTTAALGCAFRALGHGCKVCVVQFIKGPVKSGELLAVEKFQGQIEIRPMGKGFIFSEREAKGSTRVARRAWAFAKDALGSTAYDLVILDELTYLMNFGLIDTGEVLEALRARPPSLHVIVTGRNAPGALIEEADIATEMSEVKHPLAAGLGAQKGIDY